MNIKDAKQQLKNAMEAYFTCDEYGNFLIPQEEQRPVFLVGPPGIGKTAIMKQIADEMQVGLVTYSMTHHTRQSALGLPLIVHKNYGGEDVPVTEYTMSEIIASVYNMIENAGAEHGILFLDEINCVSETLTPTMLQFLQYKTFGAHKVPDGWIVVTAGNPPEFNKSVREFDVVTYDRLKRIDVEPDYAAWKEYAVNRGVHPSILTYLDAKKDLFYRIKSDVDGKRFVTARGWIDLSDMIYLYEKKGIPVDKLLTSQYLQDSEIAEDFAVYYDIFNKYKSDYKVDQILGGKCPDEIRERAKNAPFDEKLSLIGLLLDSVNTSMREIIQKEDMIKMLQSALKEVKSGLPIEGVLKNAVDMKETEERRGIQTPAKRRAYDEVIAFLKNHSREGVSFEQIKNDYDSLVSDMKKEASDISVRLENLFAFAEEVWENGQEMLIIVTELTISRYASRFISRYGSKGYSRHSDELMFYERNAEIIKQLEQLEQFGI